MADFSFLNENKGLAVSGNQSIQTAKRTTVAQTAPEISMPTSGTAAVWENVARVTGQMSDQFQKEAALAETRYLAGLENDVMAKAVEFRNKYNHDPQGFDTAWQEFMAKTLAGVPGRSQEAARMVLQERHTQVKDTLLGERRSRDRSLASETINANWSNLQDEILAESRSGQFGPKMDMLFAKAGALQESAVNLELKSRDAASIALDDLRDMAKSQAIIGGVERTYDAKGYTAAKASLEALNDPSLNLSLAQRDALISKGESELEKRLSRDRLPLLQELSGVEDAARLGLVVDEKKLDGLAARANALGLSKEAIAIQKFSAVQSETTLFARKALTVQVQELAGLKESIESGDTSLTDKYAAFEKVLETKQKMLTTDPWAYYSAHSLIDAPEPLSLESIDKMGDVLAQRRVSQDVVQRLDNVAMPLLQKSEISQLQQIYEAGDPVATSGVITMLAQNLSPQELTRVAAAIAPEKPALAVAMSTGDPRVAQRILSGEKAKGEVDATKMRKSINEYIGGTIFNAETNESAHKAISAYYKQLSLEEGDASPEINSDRMKRAVEDIMGKKESISIRAPFIHAPGTFFKRDSEIFTYKDADGRPVKANRLEDILGGITDDVLRQTNGNVPRTSDGEPVAAQDILRKARFITLGDGVYGATYDGLGIITDDKGKPYRFDARKIEQALGK